MLSLSPFFATCELDERAVAGEPRCAPTIADGRYTQPILPAARHFLTLPTNASLPTSHHLQETKMYKL